MRIITVIPAYNEGGRVGGVIRGARPFVDEIIVVDDGSTDATAFEAKEAGARVLRHAINRGQGAALQTGVEEALRRGAAVIVHMDADGQFVPEEIPRLVEPVVSGRVDVALGSRFLSGTSQVPFFRSMLLRTGVLFTGLVSGLWLSDTHNGFRAFSREAAACCPITLDLMAHASEILDRIACQRLRCEEVPVTVRYSVETLRKGQHSLGSLRIVFDLVKAKLFQ